MIQPPSDHSFDPGLPEKQPVRDETKFAQPKITIFQYVAAAIFLFLISGFWKLQVQNPEFYDERAMENSIKSVPIIAPRGRIMDRDGRVIVDNHTSYSLFLARELLKDEHLGAIAQGLDLDYDGLIDEVRRFRKQPKYVPIRIKDELSPADLAFVDSHHDFFPELLVISAQRRLYPRDGMMAHVIGYTGEISEEELDSPEFANFEPGAVIGKFGLERQYNRTLTGIDGQRQVLVDNLGQVRAELKNKPAVPGKDLKLTIDLDLQAVAELAMDGRNGAVVALDPRTGEVLAMVSRPTFDPNKFAVRIKSKDWKEIMSNKDNPMLNRAIQAQLAPGSTFKPIMALAGLETGTMDDKWTVHCPGGATFYGRYYHCHLKGGHGTVALHKAIVDSCDVYFYTLGNKMGIDKIAFYEDMVGYGRKTGIDLPNEAEGVAPSEKWKLRTQRQKWYAGDTISLSIGQGALAVTPLQLARAIGGIAMGGKWSQPHLVDTPGWKDQPAEWSLGQDHVKDVVDGMCGVVNEAGATGVRAHIPGIEVCGKTGTAQVASEDYVKAHKGNGENLNDNAWFVGFAPGDAPEIVVCALFEHGAESKFAAPIVRDVIKAYFDKKVRLTLLQQQKDQLAGKVAALATMPFSGAGVPVPVSAAPRPASTQP